MPHVTSIISQSGAGVSLEARVAGVYLAAMLAGSGGPTSEATEIVERVDFQRTDPVAGFDDLHVWSRTPQGSSRTAFLQIKRTLSGERSDGAFKRPVADATRHLISGGDDDVQFRIVASQSAMHSRDVDRARSAARSSSDGADFWSRWNAPGQSSKTERDYSSAVEWVVEQTVEAPDPDLAWRVISRLGIVVLDVDQAESQAVSQAIDRLQRVVLSGDRGEAVSLFESLCQYSLDAAKVAGGVDRPRLLSQFATRFPMAVGTSSRGDVGRFRADAISALAGIRDDIAGVRLPRQALMDEFVPLLQDLRALRLGGEAGTGKSSVLRRLADCRREAGDGLIVLKFDRLSARTWAGHASAIQVTAALETLVSELTAGGAGLLVLDGLDRMMDAGFGEVVRELCVAIDTSPSRKLWRCIVSCRDAANPEPWLKYPLLEDLVPCTIGAPSAEDLAVLAKAFPHLATLMARKGYAELNRNLFFIDQMARHPSMAGASSELDLMNAWAGRGGIETPRHLTRDLRSRPSRDRSLSTAMFAYLRDDEEGNTLRSHLAARVEGLGPYEPYSHLADARFAGRYMLNYLQLSNWKEIEGGGLTYRSPPDEAAHLEQMQARGDRSTDASSKRAQISLAIEGGEYATADTARLAVEYAAGDLPDDSDVDVLKSRSTRLVATALLAARDGDQRLLDDHEEWIREVIDRGLTEQTGTYAASGRSLRYNRPGLATLAVIHLWLRKRSTADRNTVIGISARSNGFAALAFGSVLPIILETEPRLFKSATRAAFAGCRTRWESYGEEEDGEQQEFEAEHAETVEAAVAAEVAWLDGGQEPGWPAFPREKPFLQRPLRKRDAVGELQPDAADRAMAPVDASSDFVASASGGGGTTDVEQGRATPILEGFEDAVDVILDDDANAVHVDTRSAAAWLAMVNDAPVGSIGWGGEIVESYRDWSANINGMGLPSEAEIDRPPDQWNFQYYTLLGRALMTMSPVGFEDLVRFVTYLPDKPFGNVAETVIHAADAMYFNDRLSSAERSVELRQRMVDRVLRLKQWSLDNNPGALRVDTDIGGVVGKILFNTCHLIGGPRTYLVPAVFDRVDPLLHIIRPLLWGGPTAFVGLCVVNVLAVAPKSRHLGFLLDATEVWQLRISGHVGFWTTLGIGRRIVRWFDGVLIDAPELLAPAHPERGRVDRLLGRLVSVGIAEAHELERQIEAAGEHELQP